MRANLLLTLQAGQTFAAIEDDGRVAGCIGVLPPRAYPVSLVQGISFMSRLLFLPNPFNPSPAALLRGLPYLQAWDRLHHQVKFPHWYVFVVGVSPEFQGRGVGRQLMNPVLELADSDQCAIYLETQKQKNTGFYSRFGFELLSTEQPVTNGPTIHTMLRGA